MRGDYRTEIDGLRAIAVMAVVLFHFGYPGFSGGFIGVDIFFVISGFLITRIIVGEYEAAGRFDFANFYVRRVRRLFPALLATLAVSAVAAAFIFSPEHLKRFARELMTSATFVSNILFFSQEGYFDVSKEYKALLHTWSLSVEEQYYLVAPLLLIWILRSRRAALPFILLGVGIASLLLAHFISDRPAVFFLTPFRAFEFVIGATLVWTGHLRPAGRLAREAMPIAGLAMMGAAIHLFTEATRLPGVLTLLPTVGAALVIQAGRTRAIDWLLCNPLSVWIGRISYSLYLVHWPLLVFYGYALARPLAPADRIGLLVASLAMAAALHHLVEQPFRATRAPGRNRAFLGGAAAGGALSLVLGISIIVGQGWPWRLPPDTASLLANTHRSIELQTECQYASPTIDAALQARFDRCAAEEGKAVLVFGDSHGANLFWALSFNGTRRHVIAIQDGGCRPEPPNESCFYEDLPAFVEKNRSNLVGLVYTQKGSHLLAAEGDLPVKREVIDGTIDYLDTVAASGLPTIWVGPQWEPHYEVDKVPVFHRPTAQPDYLRDQLVHIEDVDSAIASMLEKRNSPVSYVSKIEATGPLTPDSFVIDNEYTYYDGDHWSAKGQEVFGRVLLAAVPELQALFGLRGDH